MNTPFTPPSVRFFRAASIASVALWLACPGAARADLPPIPSEETLVFADDFDDNANGWSNIGPGTTQATIGEDPQIPGVSAWFPTSGTNAPSYPGCFSILNLASPPSLYRGAVSLYVRARVWFPPPATNQVGENNKFIAVLSENNGTGNPLLPTTATNALGQLIIKPSFETTRWSQIGYAALNTAGIVTNQLLLNLPPVFLFSATNYGDYRLTFWATNDDGTMVLTAYRYNPATAAYEMMGPAQPSAWVGSGLFEVLQVVSRNAANTNPSQRSNNVRAFFDSVAVAYYDFTNLPPSTTWYVRNLHPADGTLFAAPAGGLSFTVEAVAPNAVPQAAIRLFLNGQDITAMATITGGPQKWEVSYAGLLPGRNYEARVALTDNQKATRVKTWGFSTFEQAAVKITELEEYNFGWSGSCGGSPATVTLPEAGGDYQDSGFPGAYYYLVGLPGADYFDLSTPTTRPGPNPYRPCDLVSMRATKDVAYEPFITYSTTITNYDLSHTALGEWVNVTRNATGGVARVYLRAAAVTPQRVWLDRVVGQTQLPGQATRPLGEFRVPAFGEAVYRLVPLTDVAGNEVLVPLGERITFRLTFQGQLNTLWPNSLMLVPEAATAPPIVARAEPPAGATQAERHTTLTVQVSEGQSALNPASVALLVDGSNVTAAASASYADGTLTLAYTPPVWFSSGSTHTVSLQAADTSAPPLTVSNQWSFTVLERATHGAIRINFQKTNSITPPGYLADTGAVFGDRGNGYAYGWDSNNVANAQERFSPLSPTFAHDTLNLFNATPGFVRTWSLGLPAGRYSVFAVAGDAVVANSNLALTLEGQPFLSGMPTPANPWISATTTLDITDGQLTLSADATGNNKINFIEVTPADLRLTAPGLGGGGFSFAFPTQPRRPYLVEYKTDLGDAWQTAGTVIGDGAVKTFTDAAAGSAGARYYRVQAQ